MRNLRCGAHKLIILCTIILGVWWSACSDEPPSVGLVQPTLGATPMPTIVATPVPMPTPEPVLTPLDPNYDTDTDGLIEISASTNVRNTLAAAGGEELATSPPSESSSVPELLEPDTTAPANRTFVSQQLENRGSESRNAQRHSVDIWVGDCFAGEIPSHVQWSPDGSEVLFDFRGPSPTWTPYSSSWSNPTVSLHAVDVEGVSIRKVANGYSQSKWRDSF